MTTTSRAPSRSAVITLSTAREMKSACRKIARSKATPSGSAASIWSSSASILSVSSSVLAPGCFWIDRMTAGSAFTDAVPKRTLAPMRTSARSSMRIGTPSRTATTVRPISPGSRARARPRIRISLPPEW